MKRLLKKILPKQAVYVLVAMYLYVILTCRIRRAKATCVLLQTPVHHNYGDHAIALAELALLKAYRVAEITDYELNAMLKFPAWFKRIVGKRDILITGGGNLGTFWPSIDANIRCVLRLFGENKMVILPQTAYFEDSAFGAASYEELKEIFASCRDLTIMAREKRSFELLSKMHFKVVLMPDMALFMEPPVPDNVSERIGVLVMLRNDVEKAAEMPALLTWLETQFDNYDIGDMISPQRITAGMRKQAVAEKMKTIQRYSLVVTDRLHGMIFAALTGTPCIAACPVSPKLIGIYEWLFSDCPYITLYQNTDELTAFVARTCAKTYHYDAAFLQPYLKTFYECIDEGKLN